MRPGRRLGQAARHSSQGVRARSVRAAYASVMSDVKQDTGDPRHAGRMYDKEMPINQAGMEMSKPGLPDLRRGKHSVPLPDDEQ